MKFHPPAGVLAGAIAIALAVGGCSRSAQTHLDRGDKYMEAGDIAAAVLEYRNAVERGPTLGTARLKLAEAYVRQGNARGALAEYVRAADLLPNDIDAQVKAGTLLGLAGRFEDAKARADKALAIDPAHVDALVIRANAMASLKDLDGALEQMQEALRLDPRSALQTNLGAIEAARGNVVEAEAAFRKAVERDPKSVTAQIGLGQFLWSVGKVGDAEGAFKAALAAEPSHPLANRWLAALYLRTDRAAQAEPHFRKVAETSDGPDATLALADYYLTMQRREDAKRALQTLEAKPQYWALARARTADVLHAEGKKAEALKVVDEVIAKHPTLVGGHTVRGRLLLDDGRVDEARTEAQAALKLDPRNVEAHFLLGRVEEQRGDLDAAAAAYGEVLNVNPRAAAAQVRLAMVQMQRNDLSAATQLAEQASSARPGDVQARLVLARSLLARGDIERAATVTDSVAREAAENPLVQTQVGMVAMARQDWAAARTAFEKAVAGNGALIEPLAALVSLDLREKQAARARARVEQRLAAAPRNSLLLLLAGRTWAATGDGVRAEEFLRRSIEADPSNLDAYAQLGALYVSLRKPEQAIAEFDRAAARQPKAVAPQTMSALILQAQGKEDEARQRYERIVQNDPRAAVASNNLAWIYATRGEQLDRALQLAQAAKQQLPEDPEVSDTLAFVYLKKQLPALAISPLKAAIAKVPENPSFHYHLGMAYAQTGDKEAARAAVEQALKMNPNFPEAEGARTLLAGLR